MSDNTVLDLSQYAHNATTMDGFWPPYTRQIVIVMFIVAAIALIMFSVWINLSRYDDWLGRISSGVSVAIITLIAGGVALLAWCLLCHIGAAVGVGDVVDQRTPDEVLRASYGRDLVITDPKRDDVVTVSYRGNDGTYRTATMYISINTVRIVDNTTQQPLTIEHLYQTPKES